MPSKNSRNMRNVRFHENLLDLLSKQYEAAKIDEAKSAPIIEVIDYATTPDKKDSPHGSLIILISGLLGAGAASGNRWLHIKARKVRSVVKLFTILVLYKLRPRDFFPGKP